MLQHSSSIDEIGRVLAILFPILPRYQLLVFTHGSKDLLERTLVALAREPIAPLDLPHGRREVNQV